MVTARQPNDGLYLQLSERMSAGAGDSIQSLRRIGDCEAPAIIAAAVYAGHRYAREIDIADEADISVKRDRFLDSA